VVLAPHPFITEKEFHCQRHFRCCSVCQLPVKQFIWSPLLVTCNEGPFYVILIQWMLRVERFLRNLLLKISRPMLNTSKSPKFIWDALTSKCLVCRALRSLVRFYIQNISLSTWWLQSFHFQSPQAGVIHGWRIPNQIGMGKISILRAFHENYMQRTRTKRCLGSFVFFLPLGTDFFREDW